MDQFHSLLKRQLKKYFGEQFVIPEEWQNFICAVDDAYKQSDIDRNMLERSLELSSQELLQNNSEMRAIFQSMPDLLFRLNNKGVILSCEADNSDNFLLHPKNLTGKKIQDIPNKAISKQFSDAVKLVGEKKTTTVFEYSLEIQGQICFYEVRLVPLLEDQIIAIVRNISIRKQAEIDIIKAKEKAEESDRLKSEFLAQMSHEIRSPLNVILSFNSLLKERLEDKTDDDLLAAFSSVDNAGKRLLRTLDLILNMAAVQAGNLEVHPDKTDLSKIIDRLVQEFAFAAESKNLKLLFNQHTNDFIKSTDEYIVREILQNLIDNAIKYTPAGSVAIDLFKGESNNVCISIKDTGIGISEQYLSKIFLPFSQEDSGYSRKFDGNGLGLALIKNYALLINADIKVESKKGLGSIFTVVFNN